MAATEPKNIFEALVEARKKFGRLRTSGSTPQFKFANLADLYEAVDEGLGEFKLAPVHEVLFSPEKRNEETGEVTAAYTISRSSIVFATTEQRITSDLPLNTSQRQQLVGADLSYWRKYAIIGLLGLHSSDLPDRETVSDDASDDDDDEVSLASAWSSEMVGGSGKYAKTTWQELIDRLPGSREHSWLSWASKNYPSDTGKLFAKQALIEINRLHPSSRDIASSGNGSDNAELDL